MSDLSECRVLIVDDTESNIDILGESLGDDYEIMVAMDGPTALEVAEESKPDLILLDIMMPGIDGYQVIEQLKANAKTRDIPVIFCTAMTEDADEAKGLALGAADYIRKPFNPSIVKARVLNHLTLKLAQEDLKEQNRILEENARLRDDVERITRHDLNTPINFVVNVPKLLMDEGNLTENQVEMLQMLEESGYRMMEIVKSSLDLYKMETGEYQLQPVTLDLLGLVNQVRGETRELIGRKNLKIVIKIDGQTPREGDSFLVSGEEMLLYSMLANLIKNAVEASPENHPVYIAMQSGDRPKVIIHNQGAVPQSIRDRFFQKYSTAGKEGGTGLGTYSAKLIVETLGGDINMVTSEKDGTVVTVELPPSGETGAPTETGMRQPPAGPGSKPKPRPMDRHINILIADDYFSMRRTIVGLLRQMGFSRFLEADNGETAQSILDTETIGLVISDWNMPRMTGMELLKYIRSSDKLNNLPLIMITGEGQAENVIEAGKLQVTDYLIKPFSADLLKTKIENALTRANMQAP